ncbi:MAG: hypothetical protein AAB719_01520 [Patescibacteria group bacterium]
MAIVNIKGVIKILGIGLVSLCFFPSISYADFNWVQVGSNSGNGFGECVSENISCDFGVPIASCLHSNNISPTYTTTHACDAANFGNYITEANGTLCFPGEDTGSWGEEYYECQWIGPVTLNVSINSGQGTISAPGISCPGDCSQNFTYGDWVTILATPNSAGGFSFGSWSGACLGQTSSCSIQMNGSQNTSVSFNAPSAPTVSLNASPNPVVYNTASSLSWSSTNATSCTASGGWNGPKALSGTQSTGNLTSNQTYTLDCIGPGGSANRSVTVAVSPSSAMSVSCVGSPSVALLGQNITWTASVDSGGVPPFTYSWSGTNIPTSPAPTTNPYVKSYSTIGEKTATVTVTGGNSAEATCSPARVQINFDPDFEEF